MIKVIKVTTIDNPEYQEFETWAAFLRTNQTLHSHNDKPSLIGYHGNNIDWYEVWHLNDKVHRTGDKPSIISYFESGKIDCEQWCLDGKRHRANGKPSYISYFESGKIHCEEWHLNNTVYSEQDYRQVLEQVKSMSDTEKLLDSRDWVREMVK